MLVERYLGDRIALHRGDCRGVLGTLPADSLDACVTDPPYHLTSTVATVRSAFPGRYAGTPGAAVGFMGKAWDGGDVAFDPETWRAVYRVLKPGAHLLAMGGTRTFHRLACAIEDAGFEVRDTISWLYGSGFPKSHDVSKGIDRAAGAERPRTIPNTQGKPINAWKVEHGGQANHWQAEAYQRGENFMLKSNVSITDAARQWEGWGTALKPACELIVLARKPLSEGTVAANVLRWGTGAINVDGCRVGVRERPKVTDPKHNGHEHNCYGAPSGGGKLLPDARWPANVVHDGSEEVVAGFPDSDGGGDIHRRSSPKTDGIYGAFAGDDRWMGYGDSGSAARFFYTAKADSDDRLGSKHPTVKPLDLMQWLVRLVTPPRGVVLDPFAGTGTTGEAAWREGMSAVLIEAEAEYQADIRRRMALALAGPDERVRESIKAKNLPRDDGPLFAARDSWAEMWAKPFDFSQLKPTGG